MNPINKLLLNANDEVIKAGFCLVKARRSLELVEEEHQAEHPHCLLDLTLPLRIEITKLLNQQEAFALLIRDAIRDADQGKDSSHA